jgi:hypothetical protein
MRPKEYESRKDTLAGWAVEIISYRLGDVYRCSINNVLPGATMARGGGATRKEAERMAMEMAGAKLGRTRTSATSFTGEQYWYKRWSFTLEILLFLVLCALVVLVAVSL